MTYHHLSVLVHRQAEKYGDRVALRYRDYETAQWIPITWNQFSGTVRQAANAFVALGVEEQENIGIFHRINLNGSMSISAHLPIVGLLFRSMQRVHPHRHNTLSTMRKSVIFCRRTVSV